jgi:hypothetical protein
LVFVRLLQLIAVNAFSSPLFSPGNIGWDATGSWQMRK